jgi:predicted PhzF superfamily epimerase YddE/YHI9
MPSQKNTGFTANVLISEANGGSEAFLSRVFAPKILLFPEDHVCGSAHCLAAPYWSRKKSIAPGQAINAAHVSQRGGPLTVFWDEQNNAVKIRGVVQIFAKGTVFLQ